MFNYQQVMSGLVFTSDYTIGLTDYNFFESILIITNTPLTQKSIQIIPVHPRVVCKISLLAMRLIAQTLYCTFQDLKIILILNNKDLSI